MKRNSLVLILMILGATGISAQTFTIDGITYSGNLTDNTCFIKEASPEIISATIPQAITYNSNEYQVISIGFAAFADCSRLENVYVPASVTSIGNSAFNGCSSLVSLVFGDSPESIAVGYSHDYLSGLDRGLFSECPLQSLYLGRNISNTTHRYATFSGNDELTELIIGEQVTNITPSMFSGCSALERVSFPESVISIGGYAFSGCSALKSITFPTKLASIEESAFSRCTSLKSIELPASLSAIEASVFSDCSSLKSVIIPESIGSIGNGAFSGCSSIETITLPQSVSTLGNNVFSKCTALQSIVIPPAVSIIPTAMFSDCSSLTSVSIAESVNIIDNLAFSGCKSLPGITIPATVTSIGNDTFTGCSALKKLTIESGSQPLNLGLNNSPLPALFAECPLENVYLGRDVSYPAGAAPFENIPSLSNLTIGPSITILDGAIFNGCTSLSVLTIENGDKEISSGSEGFTDCPIATINLGRNFILSDGVSPFIGLPSLKKLNITESATDICTDLFRNCPALTWVSIPATVSHIAGGAFANCTSLEGVSFEDGNQPIVISAEGVFAGSPIKSIYLGRNLSAEIAPFSGLDKFKELTIGSGVSSIAPRVFRGCPSLSKVIIEQGNDPLTIEEPVAEDRENTIKTLILARDILGCGFRNFYNLSSVTIHDGISTIGSNLFESCRAIKSITLPESVISIGNYAFNNCSALEKVDLPSKLCAIGEGAFNECSSLTAIKLPESLTSISDGTFAQCSALTSLEIPASIVSIGDLAFVDCHGLSELTIEDSTDPLFINSTAFSITKIFPGAASPLEKIHVGRVINFEGNSPFAELDKLTSVTVGNAVETLKAGVFLTCPSLEKVKLGSALKSIEEYAFLGCGALRSVRCEALTPPTAIQSAFPDDTYRYGTLYVAEGSMSLYQSTAPWDLFRQISSEPESGIKTAKISNGSIIYNLKGQGLTNKPTHGFFIQNGKKVIL